MRALWFVLALLVPLSQAGAATKYVSPTGTALWAACTTRDTPCALSTAQTSAAAGDVVVMLSGSYSSGLNTSTNGTSTDYITWLADVYGAAILNGLASGHTDKTLVVDNNYHRFMGVRVNVQTGPGSANVYGLFATGVAWQFLDGEITYTGDESVTGAGNIIYCAQLRSAGLFSGNHVHTCTYGVNVFSTTAGFAVEVSRNVFEDFTVGDPEDSDCMSVSGAASYDWAGTIFVENDCSGYRDDGLDMLNGDNILSTRNEFHHPASDANLNSSCVKLGYEGANGNRSLQDHCYGLDADPNMRNYGYAMTGVSDSFVDAAVVIGAYRCADIAQRNAAGGANNKLRHMTCWGATDDAVQVYSGATGTEVWNSVLDGDVSDIDVQSGLTATGYYNFKANNSTDGSGTYTAASDITGDPAFVGGSNPHTPAGFRPTAGSPLCGAGAAANDAKYDHDGRRFEIPRPIGAFNCKAYEAGTRTARQ